MTREFCDLHTHSSFSDGSDSPKELIDKAEKIGLYAIALSDHNTVSGLPEFCEYARGKSVKAIPSVEFSTDFGETEMHIIAHGVAPIHYENVTEYVSLLAKRKTKANEELAKSLCDAGYKVDYDRILKNSNGIVNRVHFASALIEGGYASGIDEAFSGILSEERGFYKKVRRLGAVETIEFIKSIGAVATLAHPYLNLNDEELRRFLDIAKPLGLDAIETYYSTYTEAEHKSAQRAARDYLLLESGGSDYHGTQKPNILLGRGKGELFIPSEIAEKILSMVSK